MRRFRTVKSQLITDYIIVSVIAIVSITFFSKIHDEQEAESYSVDFEMFVADYYEGGLEYAYEKQNFLENDSVELISKELEVLDEINSPAEVGEVYTHRLINELLSFSDYYYFTHGT